MCWLLSTLTSLTSSGSFCARIKHLDDLDPALLILEVNHVLIVGRRLRAVPLQYFLHPCVMC